MAYYVLLNSAQIAPTNDIDRGYCSMYARFICDACNVKNKPINALQYFFANNENRKELYKCIIIKCDDFETMKKVYDQSLQYAFISHMLVTSKDLHNYVLHDLKCKLVIRS